MIGDEIISNYFEIQQRKSFFNIFTNDVKFSFKKLVILPLRYEKNEFINDRRKLKFFVQ
jgi:hypothetical protein